MATLIDSYSESNQNTDAVFKYSVYCLAIGQCFIPTTRYMLTSCKFYLKKIGSPTGTIKARLYRSVTGTFGSTLKPYGLCETPESATYNVADLTTSYQLIEFTFPSSQSLILLPGVTYVIVLWAYDANYVYDDSNYIVAGYHNAGTHLGNKSTYITAMWFADSAEDLCFYVYGEPINRISNVGKLISVGNGMSRSEFTS